MEKFITDEHTGFTNWSEIIIWLPVMKNRSWNQSASTVSAIGAIYRCNVSQRFCVHSSALHLHFVCRKPCFLVFYSMRSGWSASFTCSILRTTRSFWRMARLTYSESISENCATRGETKSWSGE